MASPGRPPLPRAIFSFESPQWQPPVAILLDTSVVVEALLPAQPRHAACVGLFRRLAASESTVVFNELLETELREVLFNIALKERHGNKWNRARYDGRVRRRAGRLLSEGMEAFEQLLDSLSWSLVELADAGEEAQRLMVRHGFRSYDAIHAATMQVAAVIDIATLDHGFTALPQARARVHTAAALVATMRKRRAG